MRREMVFFKKNINVILLVLWSILVNCSLGSYFSPFYIAVDVFLLLALIDSSKKLAAFILLVFSMISVVLFPIVATFGKPDINMITALLYANHEEVLTTIENLHLAWVSVGVITLAIAIILIRKMRAFPKLSKRNKLSFLVFSLCVILIPPAFIHTERGYIYEMRYPPLKSLWRIVDSFMLINKTDKMVAQGKITKSDFSATTINNDKYDTYIMVIDESVRRDYMNLYGAPFNNTPFLSSSPGIFFDNYVSSSFATVPSLTHSLIRNVNNTLEYNNTVIRLAENAGLKTFWLSNQGFYGYHDSPVAMIGMQANHYYFTKKGNARFKDYMPDTVLLPEIIKALADKKRKLITIHLVGSHFDFCERVNNHTEFKLYDKEHSCYVQSIKNTDQLVKKITSIASSDGARWSMLYFSDHGLSHSFLTGELSYRDNKKQNYSPPFAVINYDSKETKHINALRSGLDFQKMFAQWIGIDEPLLKSDCHYFIESTCLTRPQVYDGDVKLRDYLPLSDDPPRY